VMTLYTALPTGPAVGHQLCDGRVPHVLWHRGTKSSRVKIEAGKMLLVGTASPPKSPKSLQVPPSPSKSPVDDLMSAHHNISIGGN